ncbi:MAG: ribosomal protein S18 acetylase RimI-like enzyme [Candidatus Azotimanducaceae bacterium]|jgi:ribosomal protein S18 acetylase RimI-like enzyme
MKVDVRRYRTSDEAAVASLLGRVLPDDKPQNEPIHVLKEKSRHDGDMLVALIGDPHAKKISGFIMYGYDGHRGWIYQLAVDPQSRRLGLGKSLVKAALLRLQSLGCEKVNLQVRAGNTDVVEFYRSAGFRTEERISMGLLIIESAKQI